MNLQVDAKLIIYLLTVFSAYLDHWGAAHDLNFSFSPWCWILGAGVQYLLYKYFLIQIYKELHRHDSAPRVTDSDIYAKKRKTPQ